MAQQSNTLRIVGIPETNKVMAGELSRLCRRRYNDIRLEKPLKRGTGTLLYPFDERVAAVAVEYMRTASRVLRDLYLTRATRLVPLHDELAEAIASDERPWWENASTFSIRGRNLGGFEAQVGQVLGAVKNAIEAGAESHGKTLRFSDSSPDIIFALRLHDDELSLSIDLAGEALHKRGYRVEGAEAPMRENLAAVLLMLARYDARKDTVLDPMAGSGTIAIEAALMARGEALRTGASLSPLFADTEPVVIANEIDTKTVSGMRANVEAAGVGEWVETLHGDFRDLSRKRLGAALQRRGKTLEDGGLLIANPPYGVRLDGELRPLYRDLGAFCRELKGWRAAFIVANHDFESWTGLSPRIKKPLRNGNQRATFLLVDL